MSELIGAADARVDVFVGEGTFPAALTIGGLQNLERASGHGVWLLFERARNLHVTSTELRETIRWGLIGGGMAQAEAARLLDTYVTTGHLTEYVPTAVTILYAALYGPEDDPVEEDPSEGEPQAPTNETPTLDD